MHIVRNEGFLALYKGFVAQVARDIPGRGIYFFTYEFVQRLLGLQTVKSDD